jgi:hypothetical protein
MPTTYTELRQPGCVDAVLARVARVTPTTSRQWGVMTSHEMLVHLADSFRATLGMRKVSAVDTVFSRTVMKWGALRTPLAWPKGVPTRPEVDPKREGTKPEEFEADRDALVTLLRQFVDPAAVHTPHPFFGAMSEQEWMIWGYRHMDHHLRQFGV